MFKFKKTPPKKSNLKKINKTLKSLKELNNELTIENSKNKELDGNCTFLSLYNDKKERDKEKKLKTKKEKGLDFKEVEKSLKECKSHIKVIDNEKEKSLSIILENVRLVSLNEIFATFQTRPYEIFKYKKLCHQLIDKILKEYLGQLPIFKNETIKITYFREASRYLDHDSLIPSFKFFLDAIVDNGIILDDNPNIIKDITPIQQIKSKQVKSLLGIKIESIKEDQGFLNETNHDIFLLWNFKEIQDNEELINDF